MLKDSVKFFGFGQCGSRLGLEFARLGYSVSYYNSDIVDFRGSGIGEQDLLLLSGEGSGGKPERGKEIIDTNGTAFKDFLISKMERGKMQVFIAGLGGGTGGSSIIPAIEIAKEQGHKIGLILTLPPKFQGMLSMDNAMKTLRNLKTYDVNMFILADNEHLRKKIGFSDEWWKEINEFIVVRLISVFNLIREGKVSQSGVGSIDHAEILRILEYGKGLTDIRDIYFNVQETTEMDDEEIRDRLFTPSLMEGFNYKDTLAYLVNIDVPKGGSYTDFASKVFDITKNVCGSSISRLGMFVDPLLANSVRVSIINSGLKLPKRIIRSRINNLKRDAVRHAQKKTKVEAMDFSDVDGILVD
jgi:cell division GTPase FtsZ